jgi:hypothetical protein
MLLNMSVWRDRASLQRFIYHSTHVDVMRRRREWFARIAPAYMPPVRSSSQPPARRRGG